MWLLCKVAWVTDEMKDEEVEVLTPHSLYQDEDEEEAKSDVRLLVSQCEKDSTWTLIEFVAVPYSIPMVPKWST